MSTSIQRAAAQRIAGVAHAEQSDKLGSPYIGHVNRVVANSAMLRARLRPDLDSNDVESVAWLHDVLEDTEVTRGDLEKAGISLEVIEAVEVLTHRENEPRESYLERVLASTPLAMLVKLADTLDNNDPKRNAALAEHDPDTAARLRKKYAGVQERLEAALSC